MRYRVLKPFINIDGSYLRINDSIVCDKNRARILVNNGMIGGRVETAEKSFPFREEIQKEKAIEVPVKRKYRKRKK